MDSLGLWFGQQLRRKALAARVRSVGQRLLAGCCRSSWVACRAIGSSWLFEELLDESPSPWNATPCQVLACSARLAYRPFVICGLKKDLSWLARGRSFASASGTSCGTCRNSRPGAVSVGRACPTTLSTAPSISQAARGGPNALNATIRTPGSVKPPQPTQQQQYISSMK